MLAPVKNKKSKIKQKRRHIALAIIILLTLLLLFSIFNPKSYEKKYNLEEFEILEKFDKKLKLYTFEIKKENFTYQIAVEHKYIRKRKLIEKITEIVENDTICITLKSDELNIYPQCQKNNQQIDFHLIDENMKEKLDATYFINQNNTPENYEKITLKNLDDNTYYIWNYKGFYKINKNSKENINLFDKDIYNISNIAKVNDYLLIPDYNSSYYFNKFYLINMKDGKKSTWEFNESIYMDGYYLGSFKNSLYYVDKKMKIEWELIPKKKKMRKVGTEDKDGKIYQNGDWEKISMKKLTNENQKFDLPKKYKYFIEDGLYVSVQTKESKKKISNRNIKEIVAEINDKVYYISEDSLYYFTEKTGEVEVMSYFEWNFNYKNMIFIRENN